MITMTENITDVTNIVYAGLVHSHIRRMEDKGKRTLESKKAEIQRHLEKTTTVQSVPQVSDSKRENREYDKCGKYLSIAQKNKEDYNGRDLDILG